MENHTSTSRAEAERLLGIAEKLLRNKDLTGSKDFAVLAQETEPLLEGPEQILAVVEVLIAAEKRINNHPDWYSVLQLGPRTSDLELIKKQYRRLALLLHPDKNKFPFADSAFHLVSDSWAVLSDPTKKSAFDLEIGVFQKVDLEASRRQKVAHQQPNKPRQQSKMNSEKLPVRRSTRASGGSGGGGGGSSSANNNTTTPTAAAKRATRSGSAAGNRGVGTPNFWTACPYCYNMFEYPRTYEGCCLKCQNCEKVFTAVGVAYMPPKVPGKDEYYCCWGVFPMGFVAGDAGGGKSGGGGGAKAFANWMPPMFGVAEGGGSKKKVNQNANPTPRPNATPKPVIPGARKRGRPRKNVQVG